MSSGLNTLVRRVETPAPGGDRVLVVLDSASGEPARAEGLRTLLRGRRPTVSYEVPVDEWVDIDDVDREVRIFPTRERVTLRFSLRLRAPRARAEMVARAFHSGERSPAEVLLRIVGDTVLRLAEDGAADGPAGDNLLGRIGADRAGWEQAIAQEIQDATGVDARFSFDLGELPVGFPEMALRHLEVRVKDAPHRERSCPCGAGAHRRAGGGLGRVPRRGDALRSLVPARAGGGHPRAGGGRRVRRRRPSLPSGATGARDAADAGRGACGLQAHLARAFRARH